MLHIFRCGLDYAFTRRIGCGASYPACEPNPSTRPAIARRAYESLQGSPAVCPLATPRRCHDVGSSFCQRRQGPPM